MKRIIIDTNALMAIMNLKIDIFERLRECCDFRYEICVLNGTLDELERIIVEQRGKFKLAASLALQLVKKKNVTVLDSIGHVDDELVSRSASGDLVLTQDKELKSRLSKPYLTIRQSKKIILVQ